MVVPRLCCWGLAGGSGGGWGGGGGLQNCSFGRGSRMIRARSRMIRACPDDPGRGPDDPGRSISIGNCSGRTRKRREIRLFRGFGWISRGRRWGKARSMSYTRNPRIKINKTSSKSTNQKKFGGYFWWGFSDLGRNQQNQARKRGVGAPKT